MVTFDEFLAQLFADPTTLHGGAGMVQIILLMLAYGFVLGKASEMISDGSELLLLVPRYAGIVGSVVLPVLGAVPDGAIILFSGLGPDAQAKLNVGVGALAGSTIMLLSGEIAPLQPPPRLSAMGDMPVSPPSPPPARRCSPLGFGNYSGQGEPEREGRGCVLGSPQTAGGG